MEQTPPHLPAEEASDITEAISEAQVYLKCMEEYFSCIFVGLEGCRDSVEIVKRKQEKILNSLHENMLLRTNNSILCHEVNNFQAINKTLQTNIEELRKANWEFRDKIRDLQDQIKMQKLAEDTLRDVILESKQVPGDLSSDGALYLSHFSSETESEQSSSGSEGGK